MQPTTILIEREADAKVFEVIENVYPDVKYPSGFKPTEWIPHEEGVEKLPYIISMDSNGYLFATGLYSNDITATEWLAQHGYVRDGDGYRLVTPERELQVGDMVEALMDYSAHDILLLKAGKHYPVLSSEPSYFTIKCEVQKMQWKHSRIHEMFKYVAPVLAPTRTEQREKMLTERGCTKCGEDWMFERKTTTGEGIVKTVSHKVADEWYIKNAGDGDWELFMRHFHKCPICYNNCNCASEKCSCCYYQPAPYTAGQEVEVSSDNIIWHTEVFDHKYGDWYFTHPVSGNGMLLNRYRYIRPVQVQPEMPEWESKFAAVLEEIVYSINYTGGFETLKNRLIEYLRPLITPKQVTDEEIEAEADRRYLSNSPMRSWFVSGVRWALQKSEGGEG